jgi:putative addiction module component (TIGR02574 family)
MPAQVTTPPGFDELPVEEKIAYVQALWDIIAAEAEAAPVPGWQQALLEQRLAEARSDASVVRSWPEVQEELRTRLLAVHGR